MPLIAVWSRRHRGSGARASGSKNFHRLQHLQAGGNHRVCQSRLLCEPRARPCLSNSCPATPLSPSYLAFHCLEVTHSVLATLKRDLDLVHEVGRLHLFVQRQQARRLDR